MVTFTETQDHELIKSILFHPEILKFSSEGYDIEKDSFEVDTTYTYLVGTKGSDIVGLAKVKPITSVCYELHSCLLPAYQGASGSVFNYLAAKLLEFPLVERIVTWVPQNNKRALAAAKANGFEEHGFIPDAWFDGEKRIGLYIYGVEL